ncbi:MAG: hypothetical protein ACJATI_001474 [Halioglobus sp.]|jgi:hypothetical protein
MKYLKYIIPIVLILGAYFFYSSASSSSSNVRQTVDKSELEQIFYNGNFGIINDDLYYFEKDSLGLDSTLISDTTSIVSGDVLLSKNNTGAIKIGKSKVDRLLDSEKLLVKVTIDSSLVGVVKLDSLESHTNRVLKTLNSGFQIDTISIDFEGYISEIHTNGKINTNKLYDKLGVRGSDTIHVYLFESSEFFNTANAIALNSIDDDEKDLIVILGNAYLLESPYLFAHELFHGLGLTHHNEVYTGCATDSSNVSRFSVFNVMNESNIGCSRRLSARQIMILNGQSYYPKLKKDILFPEEDENCNCHYDSLGNEIERYLNSFDKNIDDTPLVGDDEAFFNKISSLADSIMPSEIEEPIRLNYQAESREMFSGIVNIPYVEKRLEIHRKLRMYNLCRWLKENAELKGVKITDDFWKLNPTGLINNMVKYYSESQKEYCAFNCKGYGNNCESEILNCDKCVIEGDVVPRVHGVRLDSTSIEGKLHVKYSISNKSKAENAFVNIVANHFNSFDIKIDDEIDSKDIGKPIKSQTGIIKKKKNPVKKPDLKK